MTFLPTDTQAYLVALAGATAQSVFRLILLLIGGLIAASVLRTLVAQLEGVLVRAGERTGALPGATRSRVATLTGVLRALALVSLWSVIAVIALSQLGLDVRPILAGAGIVGLAVGFGAQYLVRDVIAGFFLVLEDQVRVGDVARTVHIFPNGSVTTLANMTKGWSGYVVDVEIGYKEDPDRVIAVMRRVAEELRGDPVHAPSILEPIEIFGVDGFKEGGLVIKARLKTRPIQQWTVGREYRRRLVHAFAAEGIDVPPRIMQVAEPGKPLPVLLMQSVGPDQRTALPH